MRAALLSPMLARAVVAWGRPPNQYVKRLCRRAFNEAASLRALWRFGEPTKAGWPRHPLYLRGDTPIVKI